MKRSNIFLACTMISTLFCSSVMATNQGGGAITFRGAIVDAPCSIHPDDVNQILDMGRVANSSLRDDRVPVKNFGIRLIGCDLKKYNPKGASDLTGKWSGVRAKFTGTSINNNKLLKISDNVGIELTQGGKALTFGIASEKMELTGNQTLPFQAKLKTVSKAGDIALGEFTTVANFELSYE
ncbi:type 1 fimbrial protein [Yersinia kristensenii]|uniref:fimbrial protein n=1 Tax=Yersinia kristensenii TaxID=28152 RepID=UPI001C60A009|nr:fimbrial protein [Yersinia kristensenii]MBW5824454.1 type 1 fimbrial protein [Yersinia kristensenii]